jgi:hypothetical protein
MQGTSTLEHLEDIMRDRTSENTGRGEKIGRGLIIVLAVSFFVWVGAAATDLSAPAAHFASSQQTQQMMVA